MLNRKGHVLRSKTHFPGIFRNSEKGQESAPFELLVAVIIMGFVIFIGIDFMNKVNFDKCRIETETKLSRMATALGSVGEAGDIQTIDFFLSGCFNEEDEVIWVADEENESVCAAYCGAEKQLCTLLKYHYVGRDSFSYATCVNIGAQAVFPSQGQNPEKCPARDGYLLVDFRIKDNEPSETLGNKQGNYRLVNAGGDTYPIICAYMARG